MPIKLTKSAVVRDRATGKTKVEHDYIKCHSKTDLIEKYNRLYKFYYVQKFSKLSKSVIIILNNLPVLYCDV